MKLRILLNLFILCLLPLTSVAALPGQLEKDFTQIPGYVVMAIGEEFLIDLDASNGVTAGDLFAVVQKGEKVVHPITHDVIGTLDEIKGFLQVTRIKSGYSYAKLLRPAESPISKGDEISRFYQIPTRFQVETPEQQVTFTELKKKLPLLDWLPPGSAVEPLLTFQQLTGRLVIETEPGTILFSYPMKMGASVPVTQEPKDVSVTPSLPVVSVAPAASAAPSVPGAPGVPAAQTPAAAELSLGTVTLGEVWNSPAYDNAAVAMTVADFDGDSQQEIAMVLGDTLRIVRNIQGQVTELTMLPITKGLKPLALDAVDLDGDGSSELLLTLLRERNTTLASQLIEFTQGQFRTSIIDIPWFLRAVDFPEEGRVLLGQRMGDDQNPFAKSVFRVERNGAQLLEGSFLSLPQHVGIYGFTPFSDADGQLLYAFLSATDYLKVVTAAGELLWESPDQYGGSEISFIKAPEASSDDPMFAYVKTRLLVTGNSFLLPQNDGIRLLQGFRRFQKSRVVSLTWSGLSMNENWRGAEQGGYLNDLAMGDIDNDGRSELLSFVLFKHKGLFQKARSALVAYDLN